MDVHGCKVCLKRFPNGRALDCHMRFHALNHSIPSKLQYDDEEELDYEEVADWASSSSSDKYENEVGQFYGLRENPRRSTRMADPAYLVLQDGETESDSNKNASPSGFKRTRAYHDEEYSAKKLRLGQLERETEPLMEPEPVRSVSDTTTEKDLAFCLMMLSRDKWKTERQFEDDDRETKTGESDEFKGCKYKCETCDKVFKSYQALGGHRASHKKNGVCRPGYKHEKRLQDLRMQKKIHECPICFRVFSSGQALGGHKRSHGLALTEASLPLKSMVKQRQSLLDLNLPAPADHDRIEFHVELQEC